MPTNDTTSTFTWQSSRTVQAGLCGTTSRESNVTPFLVNVGPSRGR